MLLVTAEEMREIDRQTIEGIGIPGIVLMENAGAQVAQKIKEEMKDHSKKIIVLAGHGNNGGDGFVTARHLGNSGYDVETWLIGDINRCSEDSLRNFHALVHAGYKLKFWNEKNADNLKEKMKNADVIVDAMLGTGAAGALREPFKGIVEAANQSDAIRVAIDIPTGVNSNTGQVADSAFAAMMTVTLGLPKIGQYLYPGADYIGKLLTADISIPPIILEKMDLKKHLVTEEMVQSMLPKRRANSHKGTYGHTLLIGGSKDMPGAPALSASAALHSGAGLTTLAVPDSIQAMVFGQVPEAICMGLHQTPAGHFALQGIDSLDLDGKKYTAIGLGPGMGIWDQGQDWIREILLRSNQSIVMDADALNLLANDLSLLLERKQTTILTPHPGEMARLIKQDIQYVEQNRVMVSKEFATKYGVFVVLKGAYTIIASPNGEIYINSTGGPELAKGGSGDVLTGMITAFTAQKLPTINAIILAVYLHGLAGLLASSPSNYSTVASDIIDKIGTAIQQIVQSR